MSDDGYCYNLAGENIGWNNYPDDVATAEIQTTFMGSPGHRANILGKPGTSIGIGAYKGPTARRCGPSCSPTSAARVAAQADAQAHAEAQAPGDPQAGPGRRRSRRQRAKPRAPSPTPAPTPTAVPTASPTPRPADRPSPRPAPSGEVAVAAGSSPPGHRSAGRPGLLRDDRGGRRRLLLRRLTADRHDPRTQPILEAHDLTKSLPPWARRRVEALRGVSLTVEPGEFVALMGAVRLGQVHAAPAPRRARPADERRGRSSRARRSAGLDDDAATRLRRDRTGFVFQSFNLIPLLDVTENVALPFTIAGEDPRRGELADRIRDVIELVDLTGKEHHKPDQLSAGEQQRVAIARALVTRPALALRRRADRQPRLHDRQRDPRRALAVVRRARPDDRPRDPRLEGGRLRRPGPRHRRRPDPRRDRARPARRPRRAPLIARLAQLGL